jgi:hypothetical protein
MRKADEQHNRGLHYHRQIDLLEAQERGAAGAAPAAAGGPANKRQRFDAAAAAPAAKAQGKTWGGELPVEEVIGRFLDGNQGLGPTNTQVRWRGW